MDPLTIAGLAGAAGDTIGNPLFAHLTNVKNRKFAREQYKTQRADALSDWHMANEYNSPRAQMQRFQEAGLSPHLIYGQMSDAGGVRSSSFSGGQADAPRVEASRSIMGIYDMAQRKAQTDLLAKELAVRDEEIKLKQAQTISTLVGSDKLKQDVARGAVQQALEAALAPYQIDHAELSNRKIATDIALSFNEDERRTALNASNISEAVERIASMRVARAKTQDEREEIQYRIMIMRKEGVLKDYDIMMRQKGINPGDPGYWRVLKEIFDFGKRGIEGPKPWEGESSGALDRKR